MIRFTSSFHWSEKTLSFFPILIFLVDRFSSTDRWKYYHDVELRFADSDTTRQVRICEWLNFSRTLIRILWIIESSRHDVQILEVRVCFVSLIKIIRQDVRNFSSQEIYKINEIFQEIISNLKVSLIYTDSWSLRFLLFCLIITPVNERNDCKNIDYRKTKKKVSEICKFCHFVRHRSRNDFQRQLLIDTWFMTYVKKILTRSRRILRNQ